MDFTKVYCSRCLSQPFSPCTTKSGKVTYEAHAARRHAYYDMFPAERPQFMRPRGI